MQMVSELWTDGEHSVTFFLLIAGFNSDSIALDTEWKWRLILHHSIIALEDWLEQIMNQHNPAPISELLSMRLKPWRGLNNLSAA
jgi:hypothetical protein